MTKKFQDEVLNVVSFVPGLIGLTKWDSENSISLPKKDLIKGISFEETSEGLYIRIGAIIDVDIKAKIIAKELTSSIRQLAKNEDFKIKKVVVYIKGVR